MSRTINSTKNIITGVGGQILVAVLQFACRTVFIHTLDAAYFGVNGLFLNILNVLSLSELGIGTALIYGMYAPVAEGDTRAICQKMNLYRLLYRLIAGFTLVAGLIVFPFLDFFIKDDAGISNISLLYILYLLNTVSSYLLVYKRSILDTNQQSYICNIYQKGFTLLQNVLQMAVLFIFHDFILYLLVQIVTGLVSNWLISRKADKMYPFLKENTRELPPKDEVRAIFKNAYAISLARFGGTLASSTDNLLLSAYAGLQLVGLYSNYSLIIANVSNLVRAVFSSFTASVGNLGAIGNKQTLVKTFSAINFMGYWAYSYCSVCFMLLITPFVNIWVGPGYELSPLIVFLVVTIFYMSGLRAVISVYRDALGLYWYDRYKAFVEGILNLALSIALVNVMGPAGVFAGTVVSVLCVFWYDTHILYHYGFECSSKSYFVTYFINLLTMIVAGGASFLMVQIVPGENLLSWIAKGLLITVVYNGLMILFYHRTEEFSLVMEKLAFLKNKLKFTKK